MHTIMDPTVATFVGFIAEPTDVLTMAAVITGDITDLIIAPTIMGRIVGTCVEFIDVHIEGAITDTMGRRHESPCGGPLLATSYLRGTGVRFMLDRTPLPLRLVRTPAVASADHLAGMTDGGSGHADTINSGPKWAASEMR
jgi:hypothetical protein